MAKKKAKPEEGPREAPLAVPKRVTPVDIQQKEFRVVLRGYSEREVDEFLDDVTEEVARLFAENRRLREETELRRTIDLAPSAATEADAIVRRAKEEAERILAEARSQAALALERAAREAPQPRPEGELAPFIARERVFLKSLAGLIQEHADGVKADLQRASQVPPDGADPAEQEASTERVGASIETGPPAGKVVVVGESKGSGEELAPALAGRRPARSAAPEQDQDDGGEDRSLRELFWGQD